MKSLIIALLGIVVLGTSGCFGWGDYMKYPPTSTSREIWFKQGVSEAQFKADVEACRPQVEALSYSVVDQYENATKSRHMLESCMLKKGYTFEDAKPYNGGIRYCKVFRGGPACNSVSWFRFLMSKEASNPATDGNSSTGVLPVKTR